MTVPGKPALRQQLTKLMSRILGMLWSRVHSTKPLSSIVFFVPRQYLLLHVPNHPETACAYEFDQDCIPKRAEQDDGRKAPRILDGGCNVIAELLATSSIESPNVGQLMPDVTPDLD